MQSNVKTGTSKRGLRGMEIGASGVAFKVLGWVDTVLRLEAGPEGNGATDDLF